MSKYKIDIEIDVDFQKFFDDIPEGLFPDGDGKCDDVYEVEAIHDVLRDAHCNAIMKKMEWMGKEDYEYAKHHLLIEEEIGRQLFKNCKTTKL